MRKTTTMLGFTLLIHGCGRSSNVSDGGGDGSDSGSSGDAGTSGTVTITGGHRWTFSQTLADVHPVGLLAGALPSK